MAWGKNLENLNQQNVGNDLEQYGDTREFG